MLRTVQPSRKDLADWATHACGQRVTTKLENECSSGVVYCKLLDAVRPGTLELAKLKEKTNSEAENLGNYRVLQAGFEKLGMSQTVEVAQLARGQPQATLELLQKLFALRSESDEGAGGRGLAPLDPNVAPGSNGPATRKRRAVAGGAASKRTARAPTAAFLSQHQQLAGEAAKQGKPQKAPAEGEPSALDDLDDEGPAAALLKGALAQAREELRASKAEVAALTDERDFYFAKLELIEVAAEQAESGEVPATELLRILRAEEEEAPPADEEQ